TMAIGASGWTQIAGTFTGGNSNITLTDGPFILAGGSYTSTSAILAITASSTSSSYSVSNSATFTPNSGTVKFTGGFPISVTPGSGSYFNVSFVMGGDSGHLDLGGNTITVQGLLTLNDKNY